MSDAPAHAPADSNADSAIALGDGRTLGYRHRPEILEDLHPGIGSGS